MISRGSNTADFEWGLDHSRRRYRVRKAVKSDLYYLAIKDTDDLITIIRLKDCVETVVLPARCNILSGPWANTDAYAGLRLNLLGLGAMK